MEDSSVEIIGLVGTTVFSIQIFFHGKVFIEHPLGKNHGLLFMRKSKACTEMSAHRKSDSMKSHPFPSYSCREMKISKFIADTK